MSPGDINRGVEHPLWWKRGSWCTAHPCGGKHRGPMRTYQQPGRKPVTGAYLALAVDGELDLVISPSSLPSTELEALGTEALADLPKSPVRS